MNSLNAFLGDSPFRVLLKLVVVSFLVGLVMSAFGWWPIDVVYWLRDVFRGIWASGFAAVEKAAGYVLLGAAIVVPVFIVLRLLRYRRS